MHSAIKQFRSNIDRVRSLGGLYTALSQLTTSAVDATDILRAQIVLAVSALDHYIHELTRLGMLEIFDGVRPTTSAFGRFQITIDAAMAGLSGNSGNNWFESVIREKHGFLAFQTPDKVSDAIRLFSNCDLWTEVSMKLGSSPQDVKTQLRLIVERRNKIAHEADLDPSYPGIRWPISSADAGSTVQFINDICESIHSVIT